MDELAQGWQRPVTYKQAPERNDDAIAGSGDLHRSSLGGKPTFNEAAHFAQNEGRALSNDPLTPFKVIKVT